MITTISCTKRPHFLTNVRMPNKSVKVSQKKPLDKIQYNKRDPNMKKTLAHYKNWIDMADVLKTYTAKGKQQIMDGILAKSAEPGQSQIPKTDDLMFALRTKFIVLCLFAKDPRYTRFLTAELNTHEGWTKFHNKTQKTILNGFQTAIDFWDLNRADAIGKFTDTDKLFGAYRHAKWVATQAQ